MCQTTTNCNVKFTCYCQICARNIWAHQIGHRCHICEIFQGLIWNRHTHMRPHMKLLQSTMRQWAQYTYLTYITEQIWLPHWEDISVTVSAESIWHLNSWTRSIVGQHVINVCLNRSCTHNFTYIVEIVEKQ